jgi:hypothetical protein
VGHFGPRVMNEVIVTVMTIVVASFLYYIKFVVIAFCDV